MPTDATQQSRLTAAEARKIAGPTFEETVGQMVDAALKDVRAAAEKKQRSIALHGHEWVHGGYSRTKEWMAAVAMLHGLGFKVDFFYEERQFVNMYTTVEW